MSLQAQFEELLQDIQPSPTTIQNAQTAYENLRSYLRDHEDFKDHHLRTYLSGSYKRQTAIRPRRKNGEEERPDIDVIVVTNHTLETDPTEVLDLLFNTLRGRYSKIRRQARSIGIETTRADMDVVPIIAPNGEEGTLYIPDRKLETWLETNPPAQTRWSVDMNRASLGKFKPMVKLIKWWRRENPTRAKRPKGFVLECIVGQCMAPGESQWAQLFVATMENVVQEYRTYVDSEQVPFIPDPGVPGNSVTSGMTFEAFRDFVNKVEKHAELAREALESEDPEKALERWREIFGDRFPAPRTAARRVFPMGRPLEQVPARSHADHPWMRGGL